MVKDHSSKSFREVKARNLEKLAGLVPGWFDLPLGTDIPGSPPTAPNEVDALIATIRRSSDSGALTPQVAEQMRHMIEAMAKKD